MQTRQILTAAWACVLVASATAGAQVECAPSGVAAKLKLPFVRVHAPCGYYGRDSDGSTDFGPSCSPATTGVKSCADSGQACATNAECSADVCYDSVSSAGISPCDSQADCGPCDRNASCSGSDCAPSGDQACVAADDRYDTPYRFGPGGSCTLSAKSKAVKDCATVENETGNVIGLPAGPCHVTYVAARCKDIRRQDGTTPIDSDDDGFALRVQTRLTVDGSTVLDLPLRFDFSTPLEGSMELEQNTAQALANMFTAADAALPACTTMEILRAEITDGDGDLFATAGLATN